MKDTHVSTSDLIRPTATRASGMKAWVWYAGIGAFAAVIIVYLTSIFLGKPPSAAPFATADAAPPPLQAAQTFRYAGPVVDGEITTAHRLTSGPAVAPSASASAASNALPLPTVPPANLSYGNPSTGTYTGVPDVSAARASIERIALPTAAPDDGGPGFSALAAGTRRRGLQIVFGAPVTAETPVPASPLRDAAVDAAASPGVLVAQTAPAGTVAQATPAALSGGLAGPGGDTMPGRRRAPSAPYMISAGTKIYAQLDGSIQSDIAGPCMAHIVAPVVDALSGQVLIPAGSIALCYYGGLANNASRLSLTWTRLIFPDRSSYALDRVPAMDEEGHVGLGGSVDDHRARLFRSTVIGAILSAIAQRLSGTSSTTNIYVVAPATGTTNYAASAQMILDLVNRLNARDSQVPPTLIVAANSPVEIYVDRDMLFDGPYVPLRSPS